MVSLVVESVPEKINNRKNALIYPFIDDLIGELLDSLVTPNALTDIIPDVTEKSTGILSNLLKRSGEGKTTEKTPSTMTFPRTNRGRVVSDEVRNIKRVDHSMRFVQSDENCELMGLRVANVILRE